MSCLRPLRRKPSIDPAKVRKMNADGMGGFCTFSRRTDQRYRRRIADRGQRAAIEEARIDPLRGRLSQTLNQRVPVS
jgi:hypothetical protein